MKGQVTSFQLPERLLIGVGASEQIGEEVERMGATKVLIITDQGITATGSPGRIQQLLHDMGISCRIFPNVQIEPSISSLEECVATVRQGGYEVLVGLGGGSSIDTAKAVAVQARYPGSISDYLGIGKVPGRGLPTIMLPTTSGTGAEVTPNAILTDTRENVKKGIVSPHIMPDVSIVDPVLTLTAPPRITAAAGMDALCHAIESYTSLSATPHTDLYAREAIRLIASSLRAAVANREDLEARRAMALGSVFAGIALAHAGTGAVHALAYPLGGQFRVAHGLANAVLLPYVLEFNIIGNLAKFSAVAEAMGENTHGISLREAANRCVDSVRQLSEDVAIPQRLRDVGVSEDAIAGMGSQAVTITRLLDNNPREISLQDISEIYQRAL